MTVSYASGAGTTVTDTSTSSGTGTADTVAAENTGTNLSTSYHLEPFLLVLMHKGQELIMLTCF